jgi:hypothetical protein
METFSPNFLATNFAIDRATVLRALVGIEPSAKTRGRVTYTLATFAAALDAHRARNASNANDGNGSGNGGTSDTASLTQARIRIANANAVAKEMANEIAQGKYTDNEAALECFGMATSIMREVLLTMPGKISDRLAAHCEEDRIEIHEILYREVCDTLTILSSPETYALAGVHVAQANSKRLAAATSAPTAEGSPDEVR